MAVGPAGTGPGGRKMGARGSVMPAGPSSPTGPSGRKKKQALKENAGPTGMLPEALLATIGADGVGADGEYTAEVIYAVSSDSEHVILQAAPGEKALEITGVDVSQWLKQLEVMLRDTMKTALVSELWEIAAVAGEMLRDAEWWDNIIEGKATAVTQMIMCANKVHFTGVLEVLFTVMNNTSYLEVLGKGNQNLIDKVKKIQSCVANIGPRKRRILEALMIQDLHNQTLSYGSSSFTPETASATTMWHLDTTPGLTVFSVSISRNSGTASGSLITSPELKQIRRFASIRGNRSSK